MNSKVPFKFLKDLIKYYDGIFSESTLKLHSESEKRRHAKPIIASKDDINTISETNSGASDDSGNRAAKRAGSLMSFMRPSVMEDTAKWGMSSVMGVFQRNNNGPVSPEATVSTGRPISLSFGSPITQNESPPSSPKGFKPSEDSSIPSIASEVVFDAGEKIFTEPSDTNDNAVLKDIDSSQQAKKSLDGQAEKETSTQQSLSEAKQGEIDSSFFDDDDDDDDDE
jgi:hypothetical protein